MQKLNAKLTPLTPALLTAFLQSPSFEATTAKLPDLLPLIFDGKMYQRDMRRRIRAATINIGKAANDEAIQAWRIAA